MDLFGAATRGVDPQTGSYLSKEQRVAMFRASRGQGGSGGGASNGGVGGGTRVSPQSSIVVVNKLNKISQTLQNNFTSATQNVAEQVAQNRRDIEQLYKIVANRQEQNLKREQEATKQARLAAGRRRLQLREKLIEGIAGVTAAAATASKAVADAVGAPVMGFLQKLVTALGYLAAAWFIKNLPTIMSTLDSMFKDFNNTKRELTRQLFNQRGWAAGVEMFIRFALKGVKSIAKHVWRFAKWIGGNMIRLVHKIYRGISNVLGRAFGFIFRKIGNLWDEFIKRAGNLIPEPIRNAWKAVKQSPVGRMVGAGVRTAKNITKTVLSAGDSLLRGNYKEAGSKIFSGFKAGTEGLRNAAMKMFGKPIENYAQSQGVPKLNPAQRAGGLTKIFQPILNSLGISTAAASKVLKSFAKLPVVGILVDIALNKAGGLSWVDSIINGIATGIAGAVGWKAGGAVGASIGTAVMPGPGTAVGGILGAIAGSILAANLAESGLNAGREAMGMEPVVRPETSQETLNQISTMIPGAEFLRDSGSSMRPGGGTNLDGAPIVQADLSAGRFENIPSTPEGMFTPEAGSTVNFDMIELPPTTTRVAPEQKDEGGEVEPVPALSASDSEMNPYRSLALRQYQIAY